MAERYLKHPGLCVAAGSVRAYFKGNGTNVLKIAPETSIKLGLNDYLRHHIHADTDRVAPWERMLCGGISGAVGQVCVKGQGCAWRGQQGGMSLG